ncbi:MAG: uroporphyrinogen-III synthase [Primorskyibacter sp.]
MTPDLVGDFAFGPTVLLTRPAAQSRAWVRSWPDDLRAAVRVVVSPLIDTCATGPLPDLRHAAGLIVTSAAAVRAFAELDGRFCGPVYTVGHATARAAQDIRLDARPLAQDADGLVKALHRLAPPAPLIHLHGTHTRGAIAPRLTRLGLPTRGAVIYDQPERALTDAAHKVLNGTRPVIVPLFSPRTAMRFAGGPTARAPLYLVCMSPAVAMAAQGQPTEAVTIAADPTATAMTATMRSLVAGGRLGKG